MKCREQFGDEFNNTMVEDPVTSDPSFTSNPNEMSLKQMVDEGDWYSASRRFITHPWEITEQDDDDIGHNSLHSIVLRCANDKAAQELIHQMLSSDSEYMPTAATTPCNEGGWTVLHLCCRNVEVPDDILLNVAKINPSAMAVQDEEGDTPLHAAFRYGASNEILQNLVEIGYRDSNISSSTSIFAIADFEGGDLPLHSAISHNASPEIISLLLDAYPPSICAINSSHFFSPLHIAVECGRYDIVEVITRSHAAMGCVSQLLSMTSRQGHNVLNLLWEQFYTGDDDTDEIWECITNLLLDALIDPQTMSSPSRSIFKPNQVLNSAVALSPNICPVEFVAKFISNYPHLLKQQDSQGRLPLHHAILHYSQPPPTLTDSCFISDKLTNSAPVQECQDSERKDSSSASIGTDVHSSVTIVQEVKDLEDLSTQDLSVSTKSSPNAFINLFLRCFSDGAKLQDNDGNYPLHLAVEANISWEEGLKEIFHAHPDSIHVANKNQLLPIMMTKSLDCTYHLLRQSPSLFINQFQVIPKKFQRESTTTDTWKETKTQSVIQRKPHTTSSCNSSKLLKRNRLDVYESDVRNKKNKCF